MVPLTLQRRRRPQPHDNDIRLLTFRSAVDALPAPDDPLTDRLFALECLLRGGRSARAVADQLRAARADADWYVGQTWEADVPHVAALGQAISTINAAGGDPPAAWPPLLEETATRLISLPVRFGLPPAQRCWPMSFEGSAQPAWHPHNRCWTQQAGTWPLPPIQW